MRSIRLRRTLWTLLALAVGIVGCGGDKTTEGPKNAVPQPPPALPKKTNVEQ